jgi:hypothetical protein
MSAAARQPRLPEHRPDRSLPVRRRAPGTRLAKLPHLAPNPGADAKAPGEKQRSRHDRTTFALESNLSSGMEITPNEIEVIARLLGDDLKAFLAEH